MSRVCNSCDTKITFAKRVGTDRYIPLEAADREPFSQEAVGSLVVVAGEAWKPSDLIEHFRVRFGISEDAAREQVSGHPFHRPHYHGSPTFPELLPTADAVKQSIETNKFEYSGEASLQLGLYQAFASDGLDPRAEVRLDDRSRIDFMVGRIGVEVKVDGSVETVTRQLQRYAPHVDELVLVTTKAAHRDVPTEIGGKPCHTVLVRSNAW